MLANHTQGSSCAWFLPGVVIFIFTGKYFALGPCLQFAFWSPGLLPSPPQSYQAKSAGHHSPSDNISSPLGSRLEILNVAGTPWQMSTFFIPGTPQQFPWEETQALPPFPKEGPRPCQVIVLSCLPGPWAQSSVSASQSVAGVLSLGRSWSHQLAKGQLGSQFWLWKNLQKDPRLPDKESFWNISF